MNTKIIYHHLGLGDHIICNGLVRWFADRHEKGIHLLCKNRNFSNIYRMYEDNDKITLIGIENDHKAEELIAEIKDVEVLRCGRAVGGKTIFDGTMPSKIEGKDGTIVESVEVFKDVLWDEEFYHHASLSFQISYTKFHIPRRHETEQKLLDEVSKGKPIAFIHNRDSRGVDGVDYSKLDRSLQWVFSDPRVPFFDYMKVIEEAQEIHCVDSAFKHLVERIETKGKLFYHKKKSPKQFDKHTTQKEWIEV